MKTIQIKKVVFEFVILNKIHRFNEFDKFDKIDEYNKIKKYERNILL